MEIYSRLLSDAAPQAVADDRIIRFTFSTDAVALDGHRMLPGAWQSKGWDGLAAFKRNPVFLWAHDQNAPPIGKVITIAERAGVLSGAVRFAETPFANEIYELYKNGFLRACSVSWLPIEARRATGAGREPGSFDFSKCRLLEISSVTVPADENALCEARSAGLSLDAISSWARNVATNANSTAEREQALVFSRALAATPAKISALRSHEHSESERRRARASELASGQWSGFGEWALALARTAKGFNDPRLRAATGAGENDPTAGGFLVPQSFAEEILTTVYHDRKSVLSYFRDFDIPDGANNLQVPGVDETSRANGLRWGGITADFAVEGSTFNPTLPRLKATPFSAEKMIGYVVVSDELLSDVATLGTFLKTAVADELSYKMEQYTLSAAGTGAGRPLSILNSNALITVPKTSGQAAGTLTSLNLRTMWAALPAASRRRAIWAVSESIAELEEAIEELNFPQAGSANPDDLPRIMGRPVIETDVLPTIGTPGDVLLIDPAWYGFAKKPMRAALSAHVLFVSDQAVFRFSWRIDAKPLVSAPIATTDGSQRGAFVALAQR